MLGLRCKLCGEGMRGLRDANHKCAPVQALAAQLDVSATRTSGSKIEDLCSSIHGGAAICSEDLSHELWAWEDRLDLNKVMSSLVWEQTEFVMALQARLQKIQQLL